jgi:predicted membrane protein
MERKASSFSYQVILGLLIILFGGILLLDRIDMIEAREYLRWWPILLVAYGVSRIVDPGARQGRGIGWFFVILGSIFLLDKFDVFDFRIWDLWPLVFVFIGGSLVWRALQRRQGATGTADAVDSVNGFAFWSGIERKNVSKQFRGGELTAIMGGMEIDLTGAVMAGPEARIDIFVVWGGIEIRVPDTWVVIVEGTPVMGGISDESRRPSGENPPRLVIRGTAIMGGVEIKN